MLLYVYNDLSDFTLDLDFLEGILLKRSKVYQFQAGEMSVETEEFKRFDRVSHLFMSLVACDYPIFADMFLHGELNIFKSKLKRGSLPDVMKELNLLLLNVNYLMQQEEVKKRFTRKETEMLRLVLAVTSKLIENGAHVFGESHSEKCQDMTMTLPFTFLASLVGQRKVELTRGRIDLPCGRWHNMAEVAYFRFLRLELGLLKKSRQLRQVIYEMEDDRLRQVIKRFTNLLKGVNGNGNGNGSGNDALVKARDVDSASRFYPPCMANIHQSLRRSHRLSYESRYQYTLFLKDIGMPVEENILFWESEYNKPSHGSTCSHEWSGRQHRYIYQIEHLYGLIGSREPKTSHSCTKFIENPRTDGGCPFRHWSEDALKKSIPQEMLTLPDVEDLVKYKRCGMPQKACYAYLSCQKKMLSGKLGSGPRPDEPVSNGLLYVTSPLHFYNIAKSFVGCHAE